MDENEVFNTETSLVDDLQQLDAHEQPSEQMKALFKSYSRAEQNELLASPQIDYPVSETSGKGFIQKGSISAICIKEAFKQLDPDCSFEVVENKPVYQHPLVPGLLIIPDLLPPLAQKVVISKLLHRDLSQPQHQTNLHLHYELPYPSGSHDGKPISKVSAPDPCGSTDNNSATAACYTQSFFNYPPTSSVRFLPRDSTMHKPLSIKQVFDRRLHWMTLGGQYDWTARVYPENSSSCSSAPSSPGFPADIAGFLAALFPATLPQAAIVNLYSPGDTMMMHRDVSEKVNRGLVSLSFGCDGLFLIEVGANDAGEADRGDCHPAGPDAENPDGSTTSKRHLLLRLRSGDAMYMTKQSRYAWHGVPKVLKGTCPDYLADWPAENGEFEDWRGWMKNKRINLNVRQMN